MIEPALIELKAVRRRHETGLLALDGVDLCVATGEFVALLGPLGCGKRSLLRLVTGQDRPTAGQVLRDGGTTRFEAGAVAQVFPEPSLLPWASVTTNVELPLRHRGTDAETRASAAQDALRRVGLSDLGDAPPRGLSAGQRLRVALARALVTRPRLLLLDDPMRSLDAATRVETIAVLRQLWREDARRADASAGFTVVLATERVDTALLAADRVLVMSASPGRIVADLAVPGRPDRDPDFLDSAAGIDLHERIAALLAADTERRVA